ncbi:hypothetical protein [Deinococcus sp.]|uniref:hypothetical protein n=1 Tax=Deinococcus sp. TaxID=47478 RepID=UPI003CC6A4F8
MRTLTVSLLLAAGLLGSAAAQQTTLQLQTPIQQLQLQPYQTREELLTPLSSALMPGMTTMPQGQLQNRIGVMSQPVLSRRLELLGYRTLQPFVVGTRLSLGKLQATQVVSSNILNAVVQKDGVQLQLEIDPFTGLIKELK